MASRLISASLARLPRQLTAGKISNENIVPISNVYIFLAKSAIRTTPVRAFTSTSVKCQGKISEEWKYGIK